MLKLYRICRNIYEPSDPSGTSQIPGRWHSYGNKVLYFSSSLALCVLELKANSVSFETIKKEFHYIDIEIEPKITSIEEVPDSFYKTNWNLDRQLTQSRGNKWYGTCKFPILKVYSAVLKSEFNFILNTAHTDFNKIKFPSPKVIPLDSRLR